MKTKNIRLICFILTIYSLLSFASVTASAEACADESVEVLADNVEIGSRLFDLFFGEEKEGDKTVSLIPGGGVFGVRIKQEYPTVTEAKGIPALAGGDIIISVAGQRVKTAADVKRIVEASGGSSITIRALHRGSEIALEIIPTLKDGEYRLGLSLRDGACGLGTVTFIDPETGAFGGLGHGICDADSGEIISMESGLVCGVILGGIHKGESGKPGELCGILTENNMGELTVNNECGVFGILTDKSAISGSLMEIGRRDEVKEGEATIISTLKNGKKAEYKIEIYDIDRTSDGSKSFRVRVTDETLKALTGGIVRGMSGSPIIQNGKLVGAVTHVLVADPTEGYGIFIENMLGASNASEGQKAA